MDHKDKKNDHSEHSGSHENHHEMMKENFKKRFWGSLILTIPILILSPMVQNILGYDITLVLGTGHRSCRISNKLSCLECRMGDGV